MRRGKHVDSIAKLKGLLAMCAEIRVRCSPLWLQAAGPALGPPPAPPPHTSAASDAAGLLPASRVLELQEECLADDVDVDLDIACRWSEEEVRAFFESGGRDVPSGSGHAGASLGAGGADAGAGAGAGAGSVGSGGFGSTSGGSAVVEEGAAREDLLIVPLFSWYDYGWDTEPELPGQQPHSDLKTASDFQWTRWSEPELRDYNPCTGLAPTGALASFFGGLNRTVIRRIAREAPIQAPLDGHLPERPPPERRLSGRSTFRLYHGGGTQDGATPSEISGTTPKPPQRSSPERFLAEVDLDTFCTRLPGARPHTRTHAHYCPEAYSPHTRTHSLGTLLLTSDATLLLTSAPVLFSAGGRTWRESFEEDVSLEPSASRAITRQRGGGPFVISCSHFLPRQELLPEKRLLRFPSLSKIAGSAVLGEQVQELRPDVHVFGHTHLPWDATLGGVRYVQWPLGNPKEHADPTLVKGTSVVGSFMKVYDGADGGEAPEHFTTFCAHYAEFERDLSKTELAPYVLPFSKS